MDYLDLPFKDLAGKNPCECLICIHLHPVCCYVVSSIYSGSAFEEEN